MTTMKRGEIETYSRTTGPADKRAVAILCLSPERWMIDLFHADTEEAARAKAESYWIGLKLQPILKQLRENLENDR